MAESQDVHQLEYRWQSVTDMSPVASSMSPESARLWVQRIGVWVRHPSIDAPTESVRYEMFGNGTAALAWRLRDRQAIKAGDARGGRPVVSRVLVGSADLLTPEAAAAVCYRGLPEAIGPQPGTVPVGALLPPVRADALTVLVEEQAATLDEAAARADGLDLVVAAALADHDTALAVQLRERDITRPPQANSQAVLLWGLRRTVWPILGRGGRRGWSFSTFELPLSDTDPGTLPDIVFRLAQAASQTAPQVMRKEIRVRPQDPIRTPAETLPQHLAKLLVAAYAELGGEELGRLIARAAGGKRSAERRIEVVYDALNAGMPAVAIVRDTPQRAPTRATATDMTPNQPPRPEPAPAAPLIRATPPDPPDLPYAPATPAPAPAGEQLATPPSASSQPASPPSARPQPAHAQPANPPLPTPQPVIPRTPTPQSAVPHKPMAPPAPPASPITSPPLAPQSSPPVAPPPPAWAAGSSGRSVRDAPPLFTQPGPRGHADVDPRPDTLSGLLTVLAEGPGSQGYESALQALRATNFRSTPGDRATARMLIYDHGWYADVLQQQDQVPFYDILVMIFWHAVIPDLTDRRTSDEISRWVGERKAPETVIKALYAAAVGAAGSPQLLEQAIGPALASRWRTEHGISVPVAPPPPAMNTTADARDESSGIPDAAVTQEQPPAAGHSQMLLNLLDRTVTVPVPLALAILVALIVLALATPR